jgi:tetratricopeptide (TPR) repeat protein
MGAGDRAATLLEEFEGLAKQRSGDDDLQAVLALAYASKGDLDKAESLAREVATRSPASGWANYALGACLLKKNSAPLAMEPLRKAALILPREFIVRRDFIAARQGHAGTAPAPIAKKGESATDKQAKPEGQANWQSLWKQAALTRLLSQREQFLQAGGENLRETLVAAAVFQNNLVLAEELATPLPEDSPLKLYLAAHRKGDAEGVLKAIEPWLNRKDALGLIGQNALAYAMSSAGVRARALQVLWACRNTFPDNGVSLLNSAQTFRSAGMPKFAARTLEQLIAQYPNSEEAYVLQGIVLRESGDRDEAMRSAQVAYAIFPQNPNIVLNLSQTCLDARQPAEAEESLVRALAASPNDRKLQLGLALVQLHMGKSAEALKLLESLPPNAGSNADSETIHALALAATGNWQAAEDKAKSLPSAGGLPIAPMLAATCSLKTNRPESAVEILEGAAANQQRGSWATTVALRALGKQAGETPGQDYDALVRTLTGDLALLSDFTYAIAFQWAGVPDEAYTALARIEAKAPETTTTLLPVLYDSLSKSVRMSDPVTVARELAERHANSSQVWLGVARVLRARGMVQGQQEALDKAAQTGPQDPNVFVERGVFLENSGKYEPAMSEYRQALTLNPNDPVALNNLAYCLISTKGDAKEAREFAQRALKILAQDPHVMHTLGVALLRTGELAESQKQLEKALERMPGEPTIMLDFGLALIAQGKEEEGRMQAEAAIRFSKLFGLDFPRRAEAEEVLKKVSAEKNSKQV